MIKFFDYLRCYEDERPGLLSEIETVFSSGTLILGPALERFERNFCSAILPGFHGVGVGNGTDAIHICLRALGIGSGDEVITVSNTAVPTVSAIRLSGATPRFCEIDYRTGLLDPTQLEHAITDRTKAVLPVHLFGNAVDMHSVCQIAKKHSLFIVEDCAQATGTRLSGKHVGSFSDMSAFSFYPTKNLGCFGDAGMVVSSDLELSEIAKRLRIYGYDDFQRTIHEGLNSRLDEIQAAILDYKLKRLPSYLNRRRDIARFYNANLPADVLLEDTRSELDIEHSYSLFVIKVPNRDRFRDRLRSLNIFTGIHYATPIHLMDGYNFLGYRKGSLPITETFCENIVSLPLYPGLTDDEAMVIVEAVRDSIY